MRRAFWRLTPQRMRPRQAAGIDATHVKVTPGRRDLLLCISIQCATSREAHICERFRRYSRKCCAGRLRIFEGGSSVSSMNCRGFVERLSSWKAWQFSKASSTAAAGTDRLETGPALNRRCVSAQKGLDTPYTPLRERAGWKAYPTSTAGASEERKESAIHHCGVVWVAWATSAPGPMLLFCCGCETSRIT